MDFWRIGWHGDSKTYTAQWWDIGMEEWFTVAPHRATHVDARLDALLQIRKTHELGIHSHLFERVEHANDRTPPRIDR